MQNSKSIESKHFTFIFPYLFYIQADIYLNDVFPDNFTTSVEIATAVSPISQCLNEQSDSQSFSLAMKH